MASVTYDRVSYLQSYLGQLIMLQKEGHKVSNEINQVLTAINNELEIEKEPLCSSVSKPEPIGLQYVKRVVENHPLISFGDSETEPHITESSRTVREILNELARGRTVHQLCGEYDLDINQVSGAVICAAWLLAPVELMK